MKTLLALLISLSTIQVKAAKIGPFDVNLQFCRDYEQWSSILSAYSNVQFPVTGAPGITQGIMTNTSVIVDFCSYLIQMSTLDTQGQISTTLNMANKLSGDQFTEEIELMQGYYDLAHTVYDFNNKKGRKAAFEAPSTHRRINNLMKKSAEYGKKKGWVEPDTLQSRQESERDMARLSRIAYDRAILKEAMNCPKPKDNTDFDKIYNKDILPREEANEVLREYVDFYREALLSMGVKFLMKNEFQQYANDLNLVASKSSAFRADVKQKTADTVKFKETAANPNKPTAPKSEEYTEKLTQNYQEFQVLPDNKPLQNFLKKYADKWDTWVKLQVVQRTRGLLNSPTKRVEDEFKDFSIICNRGRYAQQYSRIDPQYQEKVDTAVAKCREESTEKIEKSGGLFAFYSNDLVNKDRRIKMNQAFIWTKESFYLGNMRNITESVNEDVLGSFTQQEVQCSPIKNLAVMNQLQLKQQAANAELNQIIVEQLFKQNAIKDAEMMKKKREEEEVVRKAQIEREMQSRKDNGLFDAELPDAKFAY